MTEYEKMTSGQIFNGGDAEIARLRDEAFRLLRRINDNGTIMETLGWFRQLLALGDDSYIAPPFRCEFGKHISIGRSCFINMGAIMLDGAQIRIGDHVLIGPNCQLYTPSHSLDHLSRRRWETFCKPITVEDDVWIGGNVVINQGVTIGARSIVGANAMVARDVPPDSIVGGVPARIIGTPPGSDSPA